MTTMQRVVTAAEFEQFESKARLDLIKGELLPMPPMPGEEHGAITSDITLDLGWFIREHDLGQCYAAETRFVIERDPDTAIGPDWAFVAKVRLSAIRRKGFVPLVPDAILEVRSPSDTKREVQEKIDRWIAAGVRWALELNPATQILTVHRPGQEPRRLSKTDTLMGDDVLPGFSLALSKIFKAEAETD